ncbi:hypothetical protein BDW69DRAFT_31904 [Aspergillus filifer]
MGLRGGCEDHESGRIDNEIQSRTCCHECSMTKDIVVARKVNLKNRGSSLHVLQGSLVGTWYNGPTSYLGGGERRRGNFNSAVGKCGVCLIFMSKRGSRDGPTVRFEDREISHGSLSFFCHGDRRFIDNNLPFRWSPNNCLISVLLKLNLEQDHARFHPELQRRMNGSLFDSFPMASWRLSHCRRFNTQQHP